MSDAVMRRGARRERAAAAPFGLTRASAWREAGLAVAMVGALALLSAPAAAQSIGAPETIEPAQAPSAEANAQDGLRTIPFAEFRALTDGKTLYFELEDGQLWGREYYVPGTQDSVFVFADGECFEGYWTYDETYYCYHYRDQPSCWLHFWEGGQIKVESATGMRQVVGKIVDREPLSCEPELLSALTPSR